MSRRAVYTGSFDPITLGHLNVIERSSRLVDELIVGVGRNIDKQSMFTAEERVELIERTVASLGNVTVKLFTGLAVQFVRDCDARVIIRGVMADDEFSHVSSSLIKQITPLAGDEELGRFVPADIIPDLRAKLSV